MKKPFTTLMTIALVFTLVACSVSTPEATTISSVVVQPSSADTSATVVTSESAGTNPAAQVANSDINEAAGDYVWDSAAVIPITLSGNSISVANEGVVVDGSTATITAAGTYSLTGALPSIWVDEGRMLQVLKNLVENALRYTPKGGKITLAAQASEKVQMRVTDSGSGIEPDDLPYVFDRFYRADKAREGNSGKMGLGLAICRALVTAQGGVISAESQGKGLGTTIVIAFYPVG